MLNIYRHTTSSHDTYIFCRAGEVTDLNAMAIVNSTNEALNDRNPVSERLLSRAGPELRKELKRTVVSKFK